MFCPFICREIHSGMGSSKNHPISLPPRVNPPMLSLILDYCRFHQVLGRSNKVIKDCWCLNSVNAIDLYIGGKSLLGLGIQVSEEFDG